MRRIALALVVVVVAGLAVGDAGFGVSARLSADAGLSGISRPVGITVGPDGALWFTNAGNETIGRLDTDGMLDRFTAAGVDRPWGITAGPDKAVWFTNRGSNSIGRISDRR